MQFIIDETEAGKRLDQALSRRFPDYSRAKLQKCIRDGNCKIDCQISQSPGTRLRIGQILEFDPPESQSSIQPENGELQILYQDQDIAIICKPPHLTVHPCPSCPEHTLAHRLLTHFPQLRQQDGDRPGIVHRLDKDTSGLMIIALNENTRQKLIEAFASGGIHKEYLALVAGKPPERGECSKAIGRHPSLKTRMAIVPESHGGKPARTEWKKLWQAKDNDCALMQIRIHSGRTHQIRVHMADCGYPVLGDQLYAPSKTSKLAQRQMLHAWKLGLVHPGTGQSLSFLAPPPEDFYECMFQQARNMRKIVVTGNQGCGKSAFCTQLSSMGMPLISADGIVAKLYSGKSAISDWLAFHGKDMALEANGAVKKPELLELLENSSLFRKEFEKFVHALVLDEIELFWKGENEKGSKCAVAEVPLYFEAGGPERFGKDAVVVGIDCPRQMRWERIKTNRGWSKEKIANLESWQMPESQKMALCDIVIENLGSRESLNKKACELHEKLCCATDEKLLQILPIVSGKTMA